MTKPVPSSARRTPSRGGKPDKLMRDALMLVVHEDMGDGSKKKKIRVLAEKLVAAGLAGDIPAIKEITDRLDGRAPQSVELSGDVGITHEEALRELE